MNVIWSRTAETSFQEELDFIQRKWGSIQVIEFLNLVDKHINTLKSGLILGTSLMGYDAYKWVISKQTSLIYMVDEDTIYLILFWNNKRRPSSFKRYLER
ncbi:type II toxin-antitoxin system RelE/ParE family toxin [Phaeocystidibacter luteus]|uniref:Type II toxin-antitoxin system RelE/ParE family toxin n=1 Tax=Phaeocystidibacter luteus TaxID=911197 RepID=A0A6N6RH65_9FLAO|nr:hypothetical protein [Phaeocystidibacter luteus]KAB2813643.1 hypothetical protein F8C67_05630 [Phaeocystidibacter luteus]